ncbi:hypothetical protein DOTSEDRAFT_38438 [Dothistroma septosporum NZE10]|uniref:Uncharacterized protein n=1 Tax=Dothistroma septosporum (strain NZE10 / CBS 128990) TaxID=675120 RepID=M2YJV0_DOTSN|nr:hypothetical protein DOTSEDRAFT_38438 [Dothistroma septosporum NZE10]
MPLPNRRLRATTPLLLDTAWIDSSALLAHIAPFLVTFSTTLILKDEYNMETHDESRTSASPAHSIQEQSASSSTTLQCSPLPDASFPNTDIELEPDFLSDESSILTTILTSLSAALTLTSPPTFFQHGNINRRRTNPSHHSIIYPEAALETILNSLAPAVSMLESATDALLEMAWKCGCRQDPGHGRAVWRNGRRVRVVTCEFCQGHETNQLDVGRSGGRDQHVEDAVGAGTKEVQVRGYGFDESREGVEGSGFAFGGLKLLDGVGRSTVPGCMKASASMKERFVSVNAEAEAQIQREFRASVRQGWA